MKLICAPMATLSHEAFRISVEEFGGCDEYFTEMINASSLLNMGPFEKYYLMNGPCPEKIVWQLTGTSAESLAKAAEIVCEKGGIGIDLNMGCSAPQIYKTGAGIAWMLKPLKETAEAVSKVKKSMNLIEEKTQNHFRFSVKCRLGNENFTEQTFFNFTDMLVENGVELITLHARTIKEKYRGLPRYEFAKKLSQRYEKKIKVYVNGCIKDTASAKFAIQKAPEADGIMIARGAQGNPWIFSEMIAYEQTGQLPDRPARREVREMMLRHARLQLQYKGEYLGIREMRKHVAWYTKGLQGSAKLREEINRVESYAELEELLERRLSD